MTKPLILIIDEFDAIDEEFINSFANEFRKMYTARLSEANKKSQEKNYLFHGLALIGVRSVLGIENVTGSPLMRRTETRVRPSMWISQQE